MSASSKRQPGKHEVAQVERFRFVVPARLEYRDAARAFLAYLCDRLASRDQLPTELGHRVISAFVEAFNNAVIHAYKNMAPGPVEVDMEVGSETLVVRVSDAGRAFTPENVPEPDLDALPEGGLGLFIIRSFMDRVKYERTADRNVLTMQKSLASSRGQLD